MRRVLVDLFLIFVVIRRGLLVIRGCVVRRIAVVRGSIIVRQPRVRDVLVERASVVTLGFLVCVHHARFIIGGAVLVGNHALLE